ncbi:hypothetical protein B0H16DRAFT_1452463 [Mycena metata]|uniref:Uncharacterized protein n=1 Tax=Mycena metata TaxID=1033252 RepID=A0AAD7NPY2_9AGAR|nr:hypothetical protein B0H16DRAFT_1452463 [Mycena metata]
MSKSESRSKEDDWRDRVFFCDILATGSPWGQAESMKSFVTGKVPSLQRIGFHFWLVRRSPIHFRRPSRRRMETRLRERLDGTEAGVAEILKVKSLDERFNPVEYSKITGKPS